MTENDRSVENQLNPSEEGFSDSEGMEEENELVKAPSFELKVSHEAKIRELLRNIVSSEVRLCSDGVKEFTKWLRGDSGGDFLYQYVRSSSKLSELMEAWRIKEKKPGLSYVLSLITVILDHPDGKYTPDDPGRVAISRVLDMFSKSIIEQRMDDLYKELNSKEAKRQKRALLLLAAIVRRGSVLASEVANVFDFKMPMFSKLAEYKRKGVLVKRKHSTRVAFIEFAMSFLEVGQPGLLRWVLQQREMFSGVLRGLGNDDDETVVYVLSTLRDRVLISESLVGPGLRSVLFGSVTLEQLANISGRGDGNLAAEVAYRVLMIVCTDPANGLIPDLRTKKNPLRGNPKRMIDLMKKLKPTEAKYHKLLLLSVVRGRPLLGSAYLDNFPFNLEDLSSNSWFSAVSFAANLVSSVGRDISWDFLCCRDHGPPSFHSSDVQMILKCVFPRPFTRAAISKGLQSKAYKIQHGTLRFLLESVKLLDAFFNALMKNGLSSLKQEIQNEVRNLIPDPQLMFNILNSLTNKYSRPVGSLKREAKSENTPVVGNKKSKLGVEEDDILIGGISSAAEGSFMPLEGKNRSEISQPDKSEMDRDLEKLAELWDLDQCTIVLASPVDAEVLFHCKLLEAFKICHCTLHFMMEASYDIFKIIPGDLLPLPCNILQSLLSLLLEHIGWPANSAFPCGILPPIYKYLQSFINLLIYSSNEDIKHQAHMLAQAALFSTGAFDSSPLDTRAWFLFLPGYEGTFVAEQSVRLLQKLSQPVVSFLCNAVSTVGNRLLKYLNDVKCHTYKGQGRGDGTVAFSPLVACILEKCLQLLRSESGTFTVPEKTMISLYVCDTLKYLLETQVECQPLSSFVHKFLSEQSGGHSSSASGFDDVACEWRPLRILSSIAASILNQEGCTYLFADRKFLDASVSFTSVLDEVKKILRDRSESKLEAVSLAFYSSLLCTNPNQLVQNMPSILTISENLYGLHHALITPLLFIDQNALVSLFRLWPEVFSGGLEMNHPRTEGILPPVPPKHCTTGFDSSEFESFAFSAFLEHAPFHLLFPSIIIGACRDRDSKIRELVHHKLSNMAIDQLILSLRLVLFWIHQMQSSYRDKPSDELQILSDASHGILASIFDRLTNLKAGSAFSTDRSSVLVAQYFPIVAQTIFSHPLVAMAVSSPLHCCNNAMEEILQDSLGGFLSVLRREVHEMDHQSFNLLSLTCDLLLTQSRGFSSLSISTDYMNKIVEGFNQLFKKIFLSFKEKFDLCVRTQDLVVMYPILCCLLSLLQYISPFELLELANWILCRVNHEEFVFWKTSSGISPVCLGFYIAAGAFTVLERSLQLPSTEGTHCSFFLGTKEKSFEVLFDGIYQKAVSLSIKFNHHSANMCLVEALNAVCRYECSQDLIFLSMGMLRVISATPIRIVSHCINAPNGHKSKFLLLLMKLSHLHMSIFGHLFLDIMDAPTQCLDDKDYLSLLPAALTYFSSAVSKFGKQHVQKFEKIPSFYARILLEGFRNWKSFVSQTMLELESEVILTSSSGDLVNVFNSSLLGSAVLMLKNYFAIRAETMSERLALFDSICADDVASEGLLNFDLKRIKSYPVDQLLNLINIVVAKISLCRALLFPDDSRTQLLTLGAHDGQDISSSSHKVKLHPLKFVDMLVCAWQLIVKKYPSASYSSGKDINWVTLVNFLEAFILTSIVELAKEMSDILAQQDSLPFLEKMIRYSLLYRFGDSTTFEHICRTFCFLSKGSSPTDLLLQLLLGHSQLASCVLSVNDSSVCQVAGLFSRPISSILRSLVISSCENNTMEKLNGSLRQLETIKLLRTLFCLSCRKHASFSESGIGINSRELLFLLLSSYGGTLSKVDMEIYAFMREIELAESVNSGTIAEFDYLWGSAAIRLRKELDEEQSFSLNRSGSEMDVDQRRSRFRENLLLDPKLCIATVLHFPFGRTSTELLPISESLEYNAPKVNSEDFEQLQRYDPAFILSFSLHCLSMEYLDPVEFSGLGLLAVALVSISSPDEGIRKLGYEVLGRFKDLVEKCPKKKDIVRLKLLLTYLQNGIHEPWQKIPSITAVFAAEASLILLDPSHDHYAAISNLLTKSSRVNLKSLPFLDKFIWSNSVDFRADRQWVLRLLYVGINLDDDALIFQRSSIPETLLSLYSSPLSDTELKALILQVMRKSVKLKRMAHHLVQSCGLISFLSSIVSTSFSFDGDNALNCTKLLVTLLEVVKEAFSFRSNVDWLQMSGFEQLSDLSSQLFRILVSGSKFVAESATLVASILETVMFALRMSMKRKIFQPHLNFSFGCLYKLYQSIGLRNDARYSVCAEFGLKAILMSAPQASVLDEWSCRKLAYCLLSASLEPGDLTGYNLLVFWDKGMDYGELSQFLVWAVSTALLLDSGNISDSVHSHCYAVDLEEASDESLTSKLLRWLVASVILGKISSKLNDSSFLKSRASVGSFLGFMKQFKPQIPEARSISQSKELLAAVIFHLQQLLGTKCRVVSSVVAALSLLLFADTSGSTGSELDGFDDSHVSLLWSKMHSPPEVYPTWRWSYYQPWVDLKSKTTELEHLDELHACEGFLVAVSELLLKRSSDSQSLSFKDLKDAGVFQRERSIILEANRHT